MALPILDGNQTSTTLATTVSGGAHYPNHILASSVTISSLPAISGTVTANVLGYSDNETSYQPIPIVPWDEAVASGRAVVVKVQQEGVGPLPISGTVTANSYITNSAPDFVKVTVESSDLALGDFYLQRTGDRLWESSKDSAGGVVVQFDENNNQWACSERENNNGIATNPDNRSSIPPITGWSLTEQGISFSLSYENPLKRQVFGTVTIGNSVTIGSLPAISGTVTVGNTVTIAGTVTANPTGTQTVAGTVTASISNSVTIGAMPSGSLTTRFGSVTTANAAQITTAVTNTNRKYLLIQNNQTGTSAGVATIGIGFTPTTTQGIQLTAGASYVADSFVPTGAVYWLGAVTGANFTIVEG